MPNEPKPTQDQARREAEPPTTLVAQAQAYLDLWERNVSELARRGPATARTEEPGS